MSWPSYATSQPGPGSAPRALGRVTRVRVMHAIQCRAFSTSRGMKKYHALPEFVAAPAVHVGSDISMGGGRRHVSGLNLGTRTLEVASGKRLTISPYGEW